MSAVSPKRSILKILFGQMSHPQIFAKQNCFSFLAKWGGEGGCLLSGNLSRVFLLSYDSAAAQLFPLPYHHFGFNFSSDLSDVIALLIKCSLLFP